MSDIEKFWKALKILKAEIAKREASPAFDQFYFDYEKRLKKSRFFLTFFLLIYGIITVQGKVSI